MCGLFTTPPNRPFMVAFPAEKRKVLAITVYPIPFFPLFHRARFTLSPCDLRDSVSEFRRLAASVTVQASFAAACLSFVDYKSAQHYNLYQRTS